MAAIEKMCEYSDEYVGPDMYRHKRAHLQILPIHRKAFRGVDCTLVIEKMVDKGLYDNSTKCITLCYDWKTTREDYDNLYYGVPDTEKEFNRWLKANFKKSVIDRYVYKLVVHEDSWDCPSGRKAFIEFTYLKPKRIIKRIRRMVGPKLKVVVK